MAKGIGEPGAQIAPPFSPDQAARRNSRYTKRTSPVKPDSSIRHCRLRIVRMTSKIVADAVVTLSKTLVFDSI
jgi:hypothetical protein